MRFAIRVSIYSKAFHSGVPLISFGYLPEIGGCRARSFRLMRLTSSHSFRNLYELSGFHVVEIAVNGNVIGNQWMLSNTDDILDNAFGVVRKCEPIDVVAFSRPRPLARVVPATLIQCSGLQAAREQIAHIVVCEQQHSAIRVVYDKPFA